VEKYIYLFEHIQIAPQQLTSR